MAKKPLSVCYLSTNTSRMQDLGKYTLKDGSLLFDIGIIFAANINYDGEKAVLYFNEQLKPVLENAERTIRPLQAKGMKILLSILGNHQGAGISNFSDPIEAQAFAKLLSDAVKNYGLDGIDFDDEWSEYGKNHTGLPNEFSFPYLVQALRDAMPPDKIISLYFFGPASNSLVYDKINVGSLINYSWNPNYGTYYAPDIPGLDKSGLAAAAVDVNSGDDCYTPPDTAVDLAQSTVQDQYGAYLYYNLPDSDDSAYLTQVSKVLYGQETVYNG